MRVSLSELGTGITAEVIPNQTLDDLPRWGIDSNTVKVGPYQTSLDHEEHLLNTVGSRSWLWSQSDELRFGRENNTLSSVLMYVPETNHTTGPYNPEPSSWLDAKHVSGILRIDRPVNFVLEHRAVRHLTADGNALFCFWDTATCPETLRLRVAADFDLLFTRRVLSGWVLTHPTQYLVHSWEHPFRDSPSDPLIQFVREYFEVVAEPNLEKMENGDRAVRAVLLGMRQRVLNELAQDERGRVLARRLEGILETFYDLKPEL